MTPMGLPKPTRLSKTADVSVEDLYLQKDYRTPKTTSALPTIFDENDAKRKKGMLMSKATRKREIIFETDPSLRKVRRDCHFCIVAVKNQLQMRKRKGSKRGIKRKFDESTDSMDVLQAKLAKLDKDLEQDELQGEQQNE